MKTCAACERAIRDDDATAEIRFRLTTGRPTGPLTVHARCLRLEPTPARKAAAA